MLQVIFSEGRRAIVGEQNTDTPTTASNRAAYQRMLEKELTQMPPLAA